MKLLKSILLVVVLILSLPNSYAQKKKGEEQRLIHVLQNEKDPGKKLLRLIALGEHYQNVNIQKADSIKTLVLASSNSLSEKYRFKALLYATEMELITGNQDLYLANVLAMEPYLNAGLSNFQLYKIHYHLGSYYAYQLDFESAKKHLDQALFLAKKARNNTSIARAYSSIAQNFMYSNLKDSAFYYTNLSIQYARRSANKSILAESFNTQSQIYTYYDQIELSVAKNYSSLQLANSTNDYRKLATYTREIGQSELLIANLFEAEKYFKQSIDYAKRIYDNRQIGLAYSNLGIVYKERKKYDLAIKYNEKAIDLLTKSNDFNGLGDAHNNLGLIYKELKKYDLSVLNYNKALVYYESTINKERIAVVYHNVGTVFSQQKSYQKALNYLNRSIAIRKNFGSKNQIYHTYRIIADVYQAIGQKEKALGYLSQYINYLDSNTSLQKQTKIAELSELYRSEERERLIARQQDSIERQRQEKNLTATKLENTELRNNQKTYIIIGFVLLIILGGIIVFYRYNQVSIKQQQKEAEMLQTLLRSQMNTHFIFNSMSVIQSYIYDNDTKNSSKFLVNFSRLIRLILENSSKEFIPISIEMEILKKYLETQKLRFEDRFEYFIEIDEETEVEDAMIPPMITQPFIENAIEHGQLHTIEGGFIRIRFRKNENMLEVLIEDNGVGRKNAVKKKSKAHTSMAINITRERIKILNSKYKTSGTLVIEDFDKNLETGTKVLISLPYELETKTKTTHLK